MSKKEAKNKLIDEQIAKLDLLDRWGKQNKAVSVTMTEDQKKAAELYCEKIGMKEQQFFRMAAMWVIANDVTPYPPERDDSRERLKRMEEKIDQLLSRG